MRAGPLRSRVEIQEPTTTKDSAGGAVVTYATVATRWGQVEPLSSRERLLAGQIQSRQFLRIRLRYFEGLSTKHRLKVGTTVYGIVGVVQPDFMKIEHICDVVEVQI